MSKTILKKDVEVVVIAGSEKGKRGKITQIITGKDRVLIEGVNMIKRHTKKQGNKEGGIIEREAPIHRSNVAVAADYDSRKKAAPAAGAKSAKKAK